MEEYVSINNSLQQLDLLSNNFANFNFDAILPTAITTNSQNAFHLIPKSAQASNSSNATM